MFIKKYASVVSKIAGVDYSKDMVDLAKAINKDIVNRKGADFRQGDVIALPWPPKQFSVAAGIETFYFWKEPLLALGEIYRVLIPGGRLVIEMAYNKDDGLDHSIDIKKMSLNLYSAEEVRDMLQASGFSDIECLYYQGFRIPFKGYVVPKGMIIRACKK